MPDSGWINGAIGSANQFENLGTVQNNGVYYQYDINVVTAGSLSEAKELARDAKAQLDNGQWASYGHTSGGNPGEGVYGSAVVVALLFQWDKINAVYDGEGMDSTSGGIPPISKQDFIGDVFRHEMVHTLGGNHGDGGAMDNFSGVFMEEDDLWVNWTDPGNLTAAGAAHMLDRINDPGETEAGVIRK